MTPPTTNASRSRTIRPVVLGVLACACVLLCGCRKPLFNPDAPRSQYDRTDALREQRAPSFVEDEFGFRKPNIRGRLLQAE